MLKLKKLTLALSAIALVSSPLIAAHKHENNFVGPYVGASLGIGADFGKSRINVFETATSNFVASLNGRNGQSSILGGVNAGWNWTLPMNNDGNWIAGVDVFADFSNMHTSDKTLMNDNNDPIIKTLRIKTNRKYGFGAGAKIGIVENNILWYGSIHWVGSHFHIKGNYNSSDAGFNTNTATSNKKKFLNGVRTGLGVEMPIYDNIKLGMEAGYSWYQDISDNVPDARFGGAIAGHRGVVDQTAKFQHKPQIMDIKLKAVWSFNGIA